MNGNDSRRINIIKTWIQTQPISNNNNNFSHSYDRSHLPQNNGFDCGIYVLNWIQLQLPLTTNIFFNKPCSEHSRSRIGCDLLRRQLGSFDTTTPINLPQHASFTNMEEPQSESSYQYSY